jgi:glucoamylase
MEIRAAELPLVDGVDQLLTDYVTFARQCQRTAPRIDLACYTVAGQPRTWTDATGFHTWSYQSDGPALQTMAVLRVFDRISPAAQATAREVIAANLDCILQLYRRPTKNLWEEVDGHSFFTRSVQLQCLDELAANTIGMPVPDGVADAREWLRAALDQHWNGRLYLSVLQDGPDQACTPARAGYDPNIDIVLGALYGAVPITDPRMLATAAAARARWSDPGSDRHYEINLADHERGIGPLLGRYPDDHYDGDLADDGAEPVLGGHPWPVSTAAFAELYYRLAAEINTTAAVPGGEPAAPFFHQVGITDATSPRDAAAHLSAAGDRMLAAILFHSDHYQLSEQFDGTTGYEKSVANLTWSYSSFLSAERARRVAASSQR